SIIVGSLLAGALGGMLAVSLFSQVSTDGQANVFNQDRLVTEEHSAVIEVAEKTRPAIVSVVGTRRSVSRASLDDFFSFFPSQQSDGAERQVSAGTGFFVTADGLIATNKHVVSDTEANFHVLTNDGERYEAQVVAIDPTNDIALIK